METNRGGAGAETLAPGLAGPIPIKLKCGVVVTVTRWSWPKSMLAMKLFESAWSQLLAVKIDGAGVDGVRKKIFDLLGESAIDLARISMSPEDAKTLTGDDFEDVVDCVNAAIDLNLTEAVVKKLVALTGKLTRAFPAGA
jgi:hypothetical protein